MTPGRVSCVTIALPEESEKAIGSRGARTNPFSLLESYRGAQMTLNIPDEILRRSGLTEKDCLVELAVHLYAERRLSQAEALQLCGLSRASFEEELARHDISLYTVSDLRADVETLKELGRL